MLQALAFVTPTRCFVCAFDCVCMAHQEIQQGPPTVPPIYAKKQTHALLNPIYMHIYIRTPVRVLSPVGSSYIPKRNLVYAYPTKYSRRGSPRRFLRGTTLKFGTHTCSVSPCCRPVSGRIFSFSSFQFCFPSGVLAALVFFISWARRKKTKTQNTQTNTQTHTLCSGARGSKGAHIM